MRLLRSLLVPLCIAPALLAQTPAAPHQALPVTRGLSADLAAARDHVGRLLVEPLVFGRVSVGFNGSYSDHMETPWYPVPILYGDPYPGAPCPPNCYSPPSEPDYQAWTLDLNVRWYPAALSVDQAQAKAMLYVGEFVGFTQRRAKFGGYYYCPVCAVPAPLDSGMVSPLPPGPTGFTQTFEAVEPGVEAGVRVQAARHLFFDVGGRWRLVRVDDPYSLKRPGDVDPRLVVSAGLSW